MPIWLVRKRMHDHWRRASNWVGVGVGAALTYSASAIGLWGHMVDGYESIRARIEWARVLPERRGEVLVVIAPFRHLNTKDGEESRDLGQRLREIFAPYADRVHLRVRIEYLREPLQDARNVALAERLGQEKNATAVIWGDITPTRNEVAFLDRTYNKGHLPWTSSNTAVARIEDTRRLASSSDLTGYAQFINRDLTNSIAFLAHLSVANILFYQQESDSVVALYQQAVRLAASERDPFMWSGMLEFVGELRALRELTSDAAQAGDLLKLAHEVTSSLVDTKDFGNWLAALSWTMQTVDLSVEDQTVLLSRLDRKLDDWSTVRSSSTFVDAQILRATLLDRVGRNAEATQCRLALRNTVRELSTRTLDYGLITRQLILDFDLKDYTDAQRVVEGALLSMEPSKSPYWTRFFEEYQAAIYAAEGKTTLTLQALQVVLENSLTPRYRAQALREIASVYRRAGDAARSIRYQEMIISEGAASTWDFNNVALSYLQEHRCADARSLYARALAPGEFTAAFMGMLEASLCLGDLEWPVAESNRMKTFRRSPDYPHLNWGLAGAHPLFALDAAIAYLKGHPWKHQRLPEADVVGLSRFAMDMFVVEAKPDFGIWLLAPLVSQEPANDVARGTLGYIYRYAAQSYDNLGNVSKAREFLAKAQACCTIGNRLVATSLKRDLLRDLPAMLRLDAVDLSDYSPEDNRNTRAPPRP
jgi:tetratricopeptide (TPR) repeat protein